MPAALVQAGIGGVLASLWSVPNLPAALVLEAFYAAYLEEGIPAAAAIQSAQNWLRRARAGELAALFAGYVHARRPSYAQDAAAWQHFAAMPEETQPYAHPYFWAAFALTGS